MLWKHILQACQNMFGLPKHAGTVENVQLTKSSLTVQHRGEGKVGNGMTEGSNAAGVGGSRLGVELVELAHAVSYPISWAWTGQHGLAPAIWLVQSKLNWCIGWGLPRGDFLPAKFPYREVYVRVGCKPHNQGHYHITWIQESTGGYLALNSMSLLPTFLWEETAFPDRYCPCDLGLWRPYPILFFTV